MSKCYDLICSECKVGLWIGQRKHIYTGDKNIEKLQEFLHKHENHRLKFLYDENTPDDCEVDID